MRDAILVWLKRYTADDRKSMRLFTTGGFMFAGGLMLMLMLDQLMQPSLLQEGMTLFGLFVFAAGIVTALWGYLGISVFKILIFMLEKNHD